MDKILQLGAIFSFCDLFDEARKAGFEPVVCDYYKDAPCKAKAKYKYDVSTTDVGALLGIAKEHDVKGVITAFSDRNLRPGMEIANALGLPTFYTSEIIDTITNKIKMKQVFSDNGLPVIPYRIISEDFCDHELDGLEFPVVVKPVDGYGSKGIVKCYSVDDVRENLSKATGQSADFKSTILVEECYEADEISISAWVKDGTSYVTCIYDVGKNLGSVVEKVYSIFPSKYTDANLEGIQKLVQKCVDSFGIKNGPITLQCFVGDKGVRVSELILRLAGSSGYKHSVIIGGPNTASMQIDYCTGREVDYQNMFDFKPVSDYSFYKYRLFAHPTKLLDFQFKVEDIKTLIPEVYELLEYRKNGDTFDQPVDDGDVIFQLYLKTPKVGGKTYNELIAEMDEKLVVLNENGKKVSFLRYSDIDWSPSQNGMIMNGLAELTKQM